MGILFFEKVCIYDSIRDETILYGQYNTKIYNIIIENAVFSLEFCVSRPDFYIKIKGKTSNIERLTVLHDGNVQEIQNIQLCFPFEHCDLQLNSDSAIISTICKNYSHRLDEWIQYNLKLGFSGIVIFNNDGNVLNPIDESLENCVQMCSTEEFSKKYKGKVWVVNFPYSPFQNNHWNSIQRITMSIGVNAFRNKCRNIALIDADEFICIKTPFMKIEDFLKNHSTINMKSHILTNKNDNDILNNNILELAKYIGEEKYSKVILHTGKIKENEFIITPHNHRSETIMQKDEIIHYHCWMNERYKYNKAMKKL